MKQLTCEMCGSTDFLKEDGVFVCQGCGTKYSVEEARKLMGESASDAPAAPAAPAQNAPSSELENLYMVARRAKEENNSENAAKYYDMIQIKDPTSWEAAFYVVYFTAMQCKIAQIQSAAISVRNCQGNVMKLIRDYTPKAEQFSAVREVELRSFLIATMLANGAKSHYTGISDDIRYNYMDECSDRISAAINIPYTCGNEIDRIFGDNPEIAPLAAEAWKHGIEIFKAVPWNVPGGSSEDMKRYVEKIGKYDPEYTKQCELDSKKKELKADIDALEKKAAEKRKGPKWKGKGILCYVIGGILLLLSPLTGGVLVGLAVGMFLLGYFLGKPSASDKEASAKELAEINEELEKKRAELKELGE